jgi:hypothetical protein
MLRIKCGSRATLVSGIAQTTPPHVNTFVSPLFYNQQLLLLLFLGTSVTNSSNTITRSLVVYCRLLERLNQHVVVVLKADNPDSN